MLLSIFTPTHYPTYLLETYRSITRQRWTRWEWVLVPSSAEGEKIPAEIREDPRVRIIRAPDETKVGALKRFACEHAEGDVFIELDHDDLLVPGETLGRIAELARGGAGFIYSDSAMFREDLSSHAWSNYYGWEHYPFEVYGRTFKAARCFPITPRTLAEIYQCPDHVRCWSRDAYYAAGGHDRTLSVGDDHDLMCRTYLAGVPFAHTGGCHYLYRMHSRNTVGERQEEIRKQTEANRRRFVGRMIREWCRREDLPLLDLGKWIAAGWTWERDLKDGFGAAGSLGAIVCHDQLQFCPGERVTAFMNYAYDALVPGGYLEIRVPSANGTAAFLDPRAKCFLNAQSFFSYTRRQFARDPERHCRYQLIQHYDDFKDDFHRRHNMLYATVQMLALKEGRYPGLKHI